MSRTDDEDDIEDIWVAAPASQGALFYHRAGGPEGAYVARLEMELTGEFDASRFELAVQTLFDRHAVLRSAFESESVDHVVQVVYRHVPIPIERTDLRHLSAEKKARALVRAGEADRRRGFDPMVPPLLRFGVYRLENERHILVLSFFHGLLDGWSVDLLIAELSRIYAAGPEALSPPSSYAPYATWLVNRDRAIDEAYWKSKLSGGSPDGGLHVGRRTGTPSSSHRLSVASVLSDEFATILRERVRESRTTLAAWVMLSWGIVLSRYGGSSDVIFGITIAQRPADVAGVEGIIGALFNTVPLRLRLNDRTSVDSAAREVHAALVESAAHAHATPAEIQRVSGQSSGRELFETAVRVQNIPRSTPEGTEAALAIERSALYDPWHYLACLVVEPGEQIGFRLDFDESGLSPVLAQNVLRHFEHVLVSLVSGGDRALLSIQITSAAERASLLALVAPNPLDEAGTSPILELERAVDGNPDWILAEDDRRTVRASEFEARANQLAHALVGRGIGPEHAVLFDSSTGIDAVDGVMLAFAIWKAGACAWFLLSDSPMARVQSVVGAFPLVTYIGPRRTADALGVATSFEFGTLAASADLAPKGRLTRPILPDAAATIALTSGSSGQPQAAVLTHRFLHLRWLAVRHHAPLPRPGDRVMGAALIVSLFVAIPTKNAAYSPPYMPWDPEAFARIVRDKQIHNLNLSPSHLLGLRPEMMPDVRTVHTGGEAISPSMVELWANEVELYQAYMTTELAAGFRGRLDMTFRDAPHVGRAMDGVLLRLLDEEGRLVPIGVEGEVYIGGPGLARGYVGRPERTAERFVPDPFSATPGARMLRTGDRGRLYADGRLELLGRRDSQVNVRGLRVELGEVEAIVADVPGVRDAAVVQRNHPQWGPTLVGYVAIDASTSLAAIRQHVQSRLPHFMHPAFYQVLPELPKSTTGNLKTLRSALPEPTWTELADTPLPVGDMETRLAAIWTEVLGVKRVGSNGHFFDLGGHSLLAMQAVSRIRESLGVDLTVRDLFEAPTVAGLAARLELARKVPSFEAPPRGQHPPLSYAQERLWFLDQLEPGSTAYHMPYAVRLEGALDVRVLEGVLNRVIERHEALRTTFAVEAGTAYQVVHEARPLELTVDIVSEEEVAERVHVEWALPFDLARGPLFRAKLLRLGAGEHVLVVVMHHIVSDGWSMGVLVKEVVAQFEGKTLVPLRVQYADYATWQRGKSEQIDRETAYWKEQLADAPALLQLPTDRPRPAAQAFAGARASVRLSVEQTRALNELARANEATLFMVLLAAWQLLLSRYSGQKDIVVGSPIANRTVAEVEPLIGFFVNTLALRTSLEGDPTFEELLKRVRETTLEAYEHQEVPFERVVEAVNPPRSLSHAPLFQAMLVLQNVPGTVLTVPGLTFSPVDLAGSTAKFDLTLVLVEADGALSGTLEYATSLFDRSSIEGLAGTFEALLDQVIRHPQTRTSELELTREADRQKLLVDWASPPTPAFAAVPTQVAARARLAPDAIAVADSDRSLSYGELDARAGQMAAALVALGVRRESRVGIALPRSLELVVAQLGVWKAGGAFVSLDPRYPPEMLAYQAQDSALAVLVTSKSLRDAMPSGSPLLFIDDVPEAPAVTSLEPLPAQAAYLIYTSGSTGRPKGTVVTHAGFANLIAWQRRAFAVTERDRGTMIMSPAFDASLFEQWPFLVSGARLEVVSDEQRLDVEGLKQQLENAGTTIACPPTALFDRMVESEWSNPTLRYVIAGGDRLTKTRGAPGTLVNVYGPTEVTVVATWAIVKDRPFIGRPIDGVRTYVLDAQSHLVPVGVPGELYLSGVQVARGYLGRADLTAERFVPDPFAKDGSRMYRTGDLVRWHAEGELEFLGRMDTQVKVRGFRIELGEVEAALSRAPGVRAAAAAVQGLREHARLVGYVVGNVDIATVRATVAAILPAHMVPSAFVVLDALPLTPTGKVNRRELPQPAREAGAYVAPRDDRERAVAAVWSEVLKVDRVGAYDDFFALGGHSMVATRVISRLRALAGVELPLSALFEAPTVESLAKRIETATPLQSQLPPISARDHGEELPISANQMLGLSLHERQDPIRRLAAILMMQGPLNASALRDAVTLVWQRHQVLQVRFEKSTGRWRQVLDPSHRLNFEELRSTAQSPAAQRQFIDSVLETMNVEPPQPVMCVRLILFDAEHAAMCVVFSHTVMDASGSRIFSFELGAAYRALKAGGTPSLPTLSYSYSDFAAWQRQLPSTAAGMREIEHWRRVLEGAAPFSLPEDSSDLDREAAVDPGSVNGALKLERHIYEATRSTPFLFASATLFVALHGASGLNDLAFNSSHANRSVAGTEKLIGFFTSAQVQRQRLSKNMSFQQLLALVKAQVLAGRDHGHVDLPTTFPQVIPILQAFNFTYVAALAETREPIEGVRTVETAVRFSRSTKLALAARAVENAGQIDFNIIYHPGRYSRARIERLVAMWQSVAEKAAENPDSTIDELLGKWSSTRED